MATMSETTDLFSSDEPARQPPDARNARGRFIIEVVQWARAHGLQSRTVPGDHLDVVDGFATIHGYRLTDTAFSHTAFASFFSIVLAAIAGGVAEGFRSPVAGWAARLALAAAVALGVIAWAQWRRARRTVVVHVAPDETSVSRPRIESLPVVEGGEVWVVARGGFTPRAQAAAALARVRCLVPQARGFDDVPPRLEPPRGLAA
jgi:hypothetical protein